MTKEIDSFLLRALGLLMDGMVQGVPWNLKKGGHRDIAAISCRVL